nr:DNA repair and recombination protein [Farysia itapuensis]
MNSAAVYSASLIEAFENKQEAEAAFEYPARNPFGAAARGPFGGAAGDDPASAAFVQHHTMDGDADQFADCDRILSMDAAGPSRLPGRRHAAISPFDYAAGWGAQTQPDTGGLTQDSAQRIATLQAKLNQRLGPEYLSQRPGPGGGKKLTYIEGWKLVDLANEVFGFNGWSTTIVRLDVDFLDSSPDGSRHSAGVSCVVRVTLRDGAFHEDIGYGSADNARQKHAALEKCKKEAVTDATKRALKNFGKLLGNCTYDHQYSVQALKVVNPAPKFDPSELHRRPELRALAQPTPQPQPVPNAAVPTKAEVSSSTSFLTTETMGPPPKAVAPPSSKEAAVGEADAAALRQQRSALARRAYLEKQQQAQAEREVTTIGTKTAIVDSDPGSDMFDADLSDVLADYDETDIAEAEAASMALDLELENARKDDGSIADDSGVAFTDGSHIAPKQDMPDTRRSLSPVKQIKVEVLQPRRAGSVGRFVSPPPTVKNGCSTLSASSRINGNTQGGRPDFTAMRQSRSSRPAAATGGVEAARIREVGRATGQAVNHSFVPAAQAVVQPRGALKRPNESAIDHQGRPTAIVRQT